MRSVSKPTYDFTFFKHPHWNRNISNQIILIREYMKVRSTMSNKNKHFLILCGNCPSQTYLILGNTLHIDYVKQENEWYLNIIVSGKQDPFLSFLSLYIILSMRDSRFRFCTVDVSLYGKQSFGFT